MYLLAAWWLAAAALVAAPARAGRFEEFTKKASSATPLKTLAATYFGGADAEEFVAAAGQPDGTIVAFGNAWGPSFPASPESTVLGQGKRYDVPDSTPGKKGSAAFDRANPNAAGLIVRYSADLKKVVGVVRFDWGVASIETGLVRADGGLVIAGRCTEAFGALAAQGFSNKLVAPAEEAAGKRKGGKFGPYAYQNVQLPGDVYVAGLSRDGGRILWAHVLAGHRQPPARLFPDEKGGIVFEANGIKRISPDGKVLASVAGPMGDGDRVKLLAVSAKDGTILHGGDRNTRTNREPWRQPFLNALDAGGSRLWRLWDWDSKTVGSDARHLESDSAVRAAAFTAGGEIVVGGWSDGGNSVFTRKIKDLDAKFQAPGLGMSSWGMKGANSLAYLMRFDPKTFEFSAWTLWVSYVPASLDGKGGNPNFCKIARMEMLKDGSVFLCGQAATGLIETPGAWFEYAADARMGGHYVALFSPDFTKLLFSSYVPACEVNGLGQAKAGLLVASRSIGKDDGGRSPPLAEALQKDFGGKVDGHVILLEKPAEQ
jgi:hypothetical protein